MQRLISVLAILVCATAAWPAPQQAPRLLIPAAASTPGLAGSHWRTDLVIHNPSRAAAEIVIELIPTGLTGGLVDPEWIILPESLEPGRTIVIEDVIGSHFPDHATGALVVVGRHTTEGPVPLVASSRTWTPESEGIGTLGQGINGLPWVGGDLMDDERSLPNLESSDAFRTNLGIVNPTWIYEQTFSVEIFDAAGESAGVLYYGLQPRAHIQVNNILARLGLSGAGYSAVVKRIGWSDITPGGIPDPTSPPQVDFATYASKVDNRTNDPSYIEGQIRVDRWGPPRHRIIPASASTQGVGDTYWTTDLSVHFPGPQSYTFVIVELLPTGGEGIGDARPERYLLSVDQGGTLALDDILGEHFPDHEVAGLVVSSAAGSEGVTDLRVTSRTWTPVGPDGGTMGQGIPSYSRIEMSDPVVIPGLEASEAFRSNLGLVNLSMNVRATFEVRILDASGNTAGALERTLEPWSHIQINQVLSELGLTGSSYTAVVTMTASENLFYHPSESWNPSFMAYGSMVDQFTGDPTYLEGVPLVSEADGNAGNWFDFSWDEPWYRCPDEEIPEQATVVRAFDRDYHWFGAENHRSITHQVDFPEDGEWNQVGLRLHLECPENGLCDHWDRTGSLQLVLNPEDPDEDWQYLEIMRHITPYRVEMCQYVDITALAPLLRGSQTLVSWIDTWVGPGHSDGEGWRISFDFVFYPGEDRAPDEVVNIWGRRNITIGYLDPDRNVDSQIDPMDVEIPADATRVEARLITTGHSFGNTDNCAEFCVLRQDLYVNDERRSVVPWRTDCEHNAVRGQQGTWTFDRNGWCPGAITIGQTIDITDLVEPGAANTIDFDIRTSEGEEYENLNVTTDPLEWISLQLYVYRE